MQQKAYYQDFTTHSNGEMGKESLFLLILKAKLKLKSHLDANVKFCLIFKNHQDRRKKARNLYLAISKTVCLIFYSCYPHNPLNLNFQFSIVDYVFCGQPITAYTSESPLPMTPLLTVQLLQNHRILAMTQTLAFFQSVSLILDSEDAVLSQKLNQYSQPYFSLLPHNA